MTSRGQLEQEHFDRIALRYAQASKSWASLSRQLVERIAPLVRGKTVLDVGNGGFFAYDPASASTVTVLDISPAMLERIDQPGVRKVVGDARELAGIEPASIDVLLFVFSLHHMCGRNPKDSHAVLDQVLGAAAERLVPGGRLLIAEPVLRPWLFAFERLLFPLTRRLLGLGGVSMIFFYSRTVLEDALRRHVRPEVGGLTVDELPVTEAVDPLGGSFPGWLRVPAWLRPTDYTLFQAVRPRTD